MEIVLAQFHKKSTVIFQMLEPEHRVVCLSYHTDTKYTEQLTYSITVSMKPRTLNTLDLKWT